MDLPDHLGSGKVSVLKPTNKNYHQDSYQEVPTEQCGPDCDSRVPGRDCRGENSLLVVDGVECTVLPANWALLGAQVTWLVSYTITNCSAYSIAITRSTSVFEGHGPSKRSRKLALQSQDPDGIRGSVACQTLILGSSLIGLVTVIVSYISQLVTRHVCVFLPYISGPEPLRLSPECRGLHDANSFVYPPGDWFSRWGLMIFSEGLAFYCYCVYLSDRLSNVLGKPSSTRYMRELSAALGFAFSNCTCAVAAIKCRMKILQSTPWPLLSSSFSSMSQDATAPRSQPLPSKLLRALEAALVALTGLSMIRFAFPMSRDLKVSACELAIGWPSLFICVAIRTMEIDFVEAISTWMCGNGSTRSQLLAIFYLNIVQLAYRCDCPLSARHPDRACSIAHDGDSLP
eukprot:scaffold104_cov375-Prasinococcus_capsulatus_cf.AAC.12